MRGAPRFLPYVPAILALCCATATSAARLAGRVIAVVDGDTITVLDEDKQQHKVRLAGIYAPELNQPYAARSRQHLANLIFDWPVEVDWSRRDRYGRIVGKVLGIAPCRKVPCPFAIDVNLAQVQAGVAWWDRDFLHVQSAEDRQRYEAAEAEARKRHRGLWVQRNPVAPWEWRRSGNSPELR